MVSPPISVGELEALTLSTRKLMAESHTLDHEQHNALCPACSFERTVIHTPMFHTVLIMLLEEDIKAYGTDPALALRMLPSLLRICAGMATLFFYFGMNHQEVKSLEAFLSTEPQA